MQDAKARYNESQINNRPKPGLHGGERHVLTIDVVTYIYVCIAVGCLAASHTMEHTGLF
jgi:hypothetical protein